MHYIKKPIQFIHFILCDSLLKEYTRLKYKVHVQQTSNVIVV